MRTPLVDAHSVSWKGIRSGVDRTVAQLPRHEAYVQQYPVLRHSDTANLMAPFGDPPLLRVVGQHATLQV